MNNGSETAPPVIVAMNIISLSKTGEVVDPEDSGAGADAVRR